MVSCVGKRDVSTSVADKLSWSECWRFLDLHFLVSEGAEICSKTIIKLVGNPSNGKKNFHKDIFLRKAKKILIKKEN